MRPYKTMAITAAALLAFTGVAFAQGPSLERGPAATVTRDQAVARADAAFNRLDANRDGRVTAIEAREARGSRRLERQGRAFDRLDTNRDGQISRAEFGQRIAMRSERRRARGMEARRNRPGMVRQGARMERMFGADGVTREAFRARALQRFARVDANRDGAITAAERRDRREMRQERRENRQQRDGAPVRN